MATKKKTTTGPAGATSDALDEAVEGVLRTAKAKHYSALVAGARDAALPRVIAASRALLARQEWPKDIVAIEGQERNLFLERRAAVLGTLAAELRGRGAPSADQLLIELLEHPDATISGYAQKGVLGVGNEEAGARAASPVASPEVLTRLATHLAAQDPLLPAAAVASHLLGALDVGARLAAVDDGSPSFAAALRGFVSLAHEVVPLTPALWDVYRRRLEFVAVLLSDELEKRAPASVLVHALATSDGPDCDEAILVGLRLRADGDTAPALRALLPRLADRPIAKRLEQLIKKLDRPGAKPAPAVPRVKGVVVTDGGPVLLASKRALASWQGALPDMPPEGDYHDASAVRGVGALDRPGGSVIVLASQAVDLVSPGDGTVWLLLAGTLEDAWAARASLRFEALPIPLDATAGDLVLQDAAYTLAAARRQNERSLSVPTKKIRYVLEMGSDEGRYVEILRLVPTPG